MSAEQAGNGIVTVESRLSVEEIIGRLERMLKEKGIKLFAVIDHSGEAEKVGMHMRNTKLLIFGNAKAGTPLMIASAGVAIDLPLKLLIREGADGETFISYNAPAYLQSRHDLPPELVQNIAGIQALAASAASE